MIIHKISLIQDLSKKALRYSTIFLINSGKALSIALEKSVPNSMEPPGMPRQTMG